MMILTLLGVLALSVALLAFKIKASAQQEKFIANLVYYALLFGAFVLLASELAGSNWHPALQMAAFAYIAIYLCWRILMASFWSMLVFQTVLVLHGVIGGYLYSATQIPYSDVPFALLSDNQPDELKPGNFPVQWVSGLPRAGKPAAALQASPPRTAKPAVKAVNSHAGNAALQWDSLQLLMQKDSEIRRVLQNLKESQERELSAMLAQLNYNSVNSTQMRRHALDRESVDNLLKERAISTTRHNTMVETWALLDSDEAAFRKRQAEERFHTLLELLEDDKVDESNKVEFIRFMVRHFADDIRLFKPLISLYDDLDRDYPRVRRLNKAFLDLYIARCNALLDGFARLGAQALQPLLDYRSRSISEMTYAKARLDRFIAQHYGVNVASLYQAAEPQSVPDFLNRRKYPLLEKLAGASFEQDYIRRDLMQTMIKNLPPEPGKPVLGFPAERYRQFAELFDQPGYPDKIDYWVIDADPLVRANLAWYLAERKDPYLMPIVFELMRDPNPEVRRLAAIAAGNFMIADTQGASDPKFIEIIGMLQNYRSNSDAFGRAWALLSLANSADKQKVLYVIDLILNDGAGYHSTLGEAAPTWRSEEEHRVIASLADTLEKTPEELLVKTYALNTLIALNSPESLGILLEYLLHVYDTHATRPGMWRYFIPHMTLPQEAENVEDVVVYLAKQHQGAGYEIAHNRHLKALHEYLRKACEANRSGEYFQLLRFLNVYDPHEYQVYLEENSEQIRIMRIREYAHATYLFWLWCWPISLVLMLATTYLVLPFFNIATPKRSQSPNARANPAADSRQQFVTPAPTIVPVKISAHR